MDAIGGADARLKMPVLTTTRRANALIARYRACPTLSSALIAMLRVTNACRQNRTSGEMAERLDEAARNEKGAALGWRREAS